MRQPLDFRLPPSMTWWLIRKRKTTSSKHTLSGRVVIAAALRPRIALHESAKRFPHIKTGADFTGYHKPE